jgi:hypothetical protein
MKYNINTRKDLDKIQGTTEHTEFMNLLKGSITRKQDTQTYPDNYNEPNYDGEKLEPIWTDIEDLSTIERFEFTKEDFE